MREATHIDVDGRHWLVGLPDDASDRDSALGLHIGPPPLDELGLPKETEIRLHNQLFARKLFRLSDVKARRLEVFAALQAAFKVDVERVASLYQPRDQISFSDNGREAVSERRNK